MRHPRVMLIAILIGILGTNTASAQQERQLRIRSVHLQGNTALGATDIQDVVRSVNQLSSGSDKLREVSERVLRRYQDIGYYKAIVSDPEVRHKAQGHDRDSQFDAVDLLITVQEGRMYRLSDVQVRGGKLFSPDEYRSYLSLKPGDIFSRNAVGDALERLRKAYCDAGYIDFTPVPDVTFDEQRGLISLQVDIDEGKQFRWGALSIEGENSVSGARQRLLDLWKSHEGETYDCGRTLQVFLREIGSQPNVMPEQVFRISYDNAAAVVNVGMTLADPPAF